MKRKGPRPTRGIAGVNTSVKRAKGRIYRYRYHRATGVRLTHPEGSAKDLAQIQRLDERVESKRSGTGTLGALMRHYRKSRAFAGLSQRTRRDYEGVMGWLAPIDDMATAEITPPFVAAMRDKAAESGGVRLANYVVTVMSILFVWGREFGHVDHNPAHRIRKVKSNRTGPRQNRAWDDESFAALMAAAPVWLRWPCAIACYAGAREGDVVTMRLSALTGDVARWTASKNKFEVEIPVLPELAAARAEYLEWREALPSSLVGRDDEPACLNSRGRPWTESGLRAVFFRLLGKLVAEGRAAKGLTFHGLRSTHAKRWAAMGDNRTIRTALGDKTDQMSNLYGQEEDKGRRLQDALKSMKAK